MGNPTLVLTLLLYMECVVPSPKIRKQFKIYMKINKFDKNLINVLVNVLSLTIIYQKRIILSHRTFKY